MIKELCTKLLELKIAENKNFIRFTFYELRVKNNWSEDETEVALVEYKETIFMDIWEEMYLKAKEEYHPEEVSPFIQAHHVVAAVQSESGKIFNWD